MKNFDPFNAIWTGASVVEMVMLGIFTIVMVILFSALSEAIGNGWIATLFIILAILIPIGIWWCLSGKIEK